MLLYLNNNATCPSIVLSAQYPILAKVCRFHTVMKYTHYFQEASTPCCFHTNILLMILPNRQRNKKNSYGIDEVSMVSMLKVLGWRGSAPWFLRKKLVAVWRPMAGGSRLSGCGARAGEETYFIVTTTTRLLELESGDSGETRTLPPQAGRIKA